MTNAMLMVGEVAPGTTATWLLVLLGILSAVSGVGGMLAVASYFATRREVDDIKTRLIKVEDATAAIREEMRRQKDEIMYSADRRSSVLHNRINPIVENLAALKGSNESFVKVFESFTEVMRSWCQRERDTTKCPNEELIQQVKQKI
jgi:hypothetical protein